jgi:hypothetical protein
MVNGMRNADEMHPYPDLSLVKSGWKPLNAVFQS